MATASSSKINTAGIMSTVYVLEKLDVRPSSRPETENYGVLQVIDESDRKNERLIVDTVWTICKPDDGYHKRLLVSKDNMQSVQSFLRSNTSRHPMSILMCLVLIPHRRKMYCKTIRIFAHGVLVWGMKD